MGLFIFLVKKEMQAAMEEKSVKIRSNSNFLHKTDKVQSPKGDCTLFYIRLCYPPDTYGAASSWICSLFTSTVVPG